MARKIIWKFSVKIIPGFCAGIVPHHFSSHVSRTYGYVSKYTRKEAREFIQKAIEKDSQAAMRNHAWRLPNRSFILLADCFGRGMDLVARALPKTWAHNGMIFTKKLGKPYINRNSSNKVRETRIFISGQRQ